MQQPGSPVDTVSRAPVLLIDTLGRQPAARPGADTGVAGRYQALTDSLARVAHEGRRAAWVGTWAILAVILVYATVRTLGGR